MYHINNRHINKCNIKKRTFRHGDTHYYLKYDESEEVVAIPSKSLYDHFVKKTRKAARKSIQRSIWRKQKIQEEIKPYLDELMTIIDVYWMKEE